MKGSKLTSASQLHQFRWNFAAALTTGVKAQKKIEVILQELRSRQYKIDMKYKHLLSTYLVRFSFSCSKICSKKAGARWIVGLLETKAKAYWEPEKQNSMDFVRIRYDMKDFVVFFFFLSKRQLTINN